MKRFAYLVRINKFYIYTAVIFFVMGFCVTRLAHAENPMIDEKGHIIGVNYTEIVIEGKTYDIPLANKEYSQEVYYLKKALKGDKEALEIFLEGKDSRDFFIGSGSPLWLHANKDGHFSVS